MKKIKLFKWAFFTSVVGCILVLCRLFYLADASQHPVGFQDETPVYLISYADGPEIYKKNQAALVQSALNKGFSHFINYRRHDLSKRFVADNKEIMSQKTGAGYWLWKPWVILHTLENAPENAIVVYADTGFVFKKHIQKLIDLAKTHGIVLIKYDDVDVYGTLGNKVQRYTLRQMKADTVDMRQKNLLWAAFGVYKNTAQTRKFLRKWLEHCRDKNKIMETSNPSYPEHKGFCGHCHDQAILSVLAHQHNDMLTLYPETDFTAHYVTWHHRSDRPGGRNQHVSLIPGVDRPNIPEKVWWVGRRLIEYFTIPIKFLNQVFTD